MGDSWHAPLHDNTGGHSMQPTHWRHLLLCDVIMWIYESNRWLWHQTPMSGESLLLLQRVRNLPFTSWPTLGQHNINNIHLPKEWQKECHHHPTSDLQSQALPRQMLGSNCGTHPVVPRHRPINARQHIHGFERKTETDYMQDDPQLTTSNHSLHRWRDTGIQDKQNWNSFHLVWICHGHVLGRHTCIHNHADQTLVQWCLPPLHLPSSPTVQFGSIQQDDKLPRLLHHSQLGKPRRPLHIRTRRKLCCTFQYWPWLTACCTMTLCLQPTPLSQKYHRPIQHWLHTHAQQSQVLEFGRMARWPTLDPNPNTNLSPYFRFYSMHSSQGQVDWFRSIFVLGQGGLEQVTCLKTFVDCS
jgi:hypothetical protein